MEYQCGQRRFMTQEEMDTFNRILLPILRSIYDDMMIMVVCIQIKAEIVNNLDAVEFKAYVVDEDCVASIVIFRFFTKSKELQILARSKKVLKYVTRDNKAKLADLIDYFMIVIDEPSVPIFDRITVSNYWVGSFKDRLTIGLMTETIKDGEVAFKKLSDGSFKLDRFGNKIPIYDVHLGGTYFGLQKENGIVPDFPTIAMFDSKFNKYVPNDIED